MKRLIKRVRSIEPAMLDAIGKASIIGLHLVSGIIVGWGIGYFLDKWLDTAPWLQLVFLIIGFIAGLKNMYTDAKRLLKLQEKLNADAGKPEKKD